MESIAGIKFGLTSFGADRTQTRLEKYCFRRSFGEGIGLNES